MKSERTCISCREKSRKTEFIRIVKTPENEILLDSKGNCAGRGAYVCSIDCLEKVVESGRLSVALKTKVNREQANALLIDLKEVLNAACV